MNTGSSTTLGGAAAIVLAALLFRPGSTEPSAIKQPSDSSAAVEAALGQRSTGEGPWKASCDYWATDREAKDHESKPPTVHVSLDEHGLFVKGTLTGDDEAESSCDGSDDKWGLPNFSGDERTQPRSSPQEASKPVPRAVHDPLTITAVIATVPDPVRTNMAFLFDRDIDAIIEAASDRQYSSTNYWMPWPMAPAAPSDDKESTSKVSQEKREHEPGIIIFRPEFANRRSALYIFLVGETPTDGINGFQMQKALRYEEALKDTPNVLLKRSIVNPGEDLDIIGPSFSGSASSLRRAIDDEIARNNEPNVVVRGTTSTPIAVTQLDDSPQACADPSLSSSGHAKIQYRSFSDNSTYDERSLIRLVEGSQVEDTRIAVLSEDGTTLGNQLSLCAEKPGSRSSKYSPAVSIRYPRDIFMLRNAHNEPQAAGGTGDKSAPPSPYLRLSLKGANASDDVPDFDLGTTPLSQEAQLMAIQRQLRRDRTDYIVIGGSNILDELFLAQNLRRAVPDARLVFGDNDLLFERDIEDAEYIGSITVGPYPLLTLGNRRNPGRGGRAFPGAGAEAYYNAVASLFCGKDCTAADYAGYGDGFGVGADQRQPPQWLTVIGSDGYYPLGIVNKTSSDNPAILPPVSPFPPPELLPFYPSCIWYFLCTLIVLLCFAHAVMLSVANYWSPFTHSLAIEGTDHPPRLCMYIHIGTVMLVSMAFVTAWPLFACRRLMVLHTTSKLVGLATLFAGLVALAVTLLKTRRHLKPSVPQGDMDSLLSDESLIPLFNLLALLALITIPLLWYVLCSTDKFVQAGSSTGLFFAYRCLNPQSGVSPLKPLLFLLSSWYMWAVFHTFRLRFSNKNRPLLPSSIPAAELETNVRPSYPLYVADEKLSEQGAPTSGRLYHNITCLLITREVLLGFVLAVRGKRLNSASCKRCACMERLDIQRKKVLLHWTLAVLYLFGFLAAVLLPSMHSVERVLSTTGSWPTPYEFLLRALFFPLLVISFTTWLRMILVWGSLKRNLLQCLENVPLRFAFDRLKGGGWMSMFRQSGLREQWRDMARSTESARQLLNDPGFKSACVGDKVPAFLALGSTYHRLNTHITVLLDHLGGHADREGDTERSALGQEAGKYANESAFMHVIEEDYQEFSTDLLRYLLIPYWWKTRHGLVESRTGGANLCGALRASIDKKETADPASSDDRETSWVGAAEEFIALRYIALIRAVLVNVRFLMIFVVISFVLAIVAWNSYPFQPRQTINWVFTFLLVFLGAGMVWVLAQMHRDPILSRITDKKPNELGWGFFLKVFSLGAAPFLTWLAYNYPEIGCSLFKLIQPGADLVK